MNVAACGGRLAMIVTLVTAIPVVSEAQLLETETARFPRRGSFELGTGFEFQTSSEGTERAVPLAVEYGVAERFSLLVEPVAYTAILPKHGAQATGIGDLEATAFYLLCHERGAIPALAGAFEVKFPVARSRLIGSGKSDYAGYLIASRHLGAVDVHANLTYTFLGQPAGTTLNNTVGGALAAEYAVTTTWLLFGEALATSASAPEGGGDNPASPAAVTPEAAGGEVVGTAGLGYAPVQHLVLSLGVSYDNNLAWQLRPGITYGLH